MLQNKSQHQTVGLSLDQAHLAQINQLMSDITSEGDDAGSRPNNEPSSQQQQQLMDLLGTSPLVIQSGNHNSPSQMQVSPMTLSKITGPGSTSNETGSSTPQQQFLVLDSQTNQIIGQQSQQQVHTIMLNGQPALFIPASSAISMNLMGQMQMQMSSIGDNQAPSNCNPHPIDVPVSNTLDFSSLLANQMILPLTGDKSSNKEGSQLVNMPQFLMNPGDGQSVNNQHQYFIQMPSTTVSENSECQVKKENHENISISGFDQQSHLDAMVMQSSQPQGQQVLCLQPDGTITVQTLPQSIETNLESNIGGGLVSKAATNRMVNAAGKIAISPYGEGRKFIPVKKRCSVSEVLREKEKKKAKKAEPATQITAAPQMVQMVQFQPMVDPSASQQWIIINNPNDLGLMNGTNASTNEIQQSISVEQTDAETNSPSKKPKTGIFKEIISNGDTIHSNASGDDDDDEDDEDDDGFQSIVGLERKKRTPCDCPNCVKFKENGGLAGEDGSMSKRTHRCHKCNKEYIKTSHLRAHLRGHENYRPYLCEFKGCGKRFTRSDELKRHRRIHLDERNFICLVCNKRFLRSDHLQKHFLTHVRPGDKPVDEQSLAPKTRPPPQSSVTPSCPPKTIKSLLATDTP